jgi:hypothetical protein
MSQTGRVARELMSRPINGDWVKFFSSCLGKVYFQTRKIGGCPNHLRLYAIAAINS